MTVPYLLRPLILAGAVGLAACAAQAEGPQVTMYKNPSCSCCSRWADHLREAGFTVKEVPSEQMPQIKHQLGVPQALGSCHTAQVGDYVIEGHVPAGDIERLLAEQPEVAGLSAPGMPIGSPGMEGPRQDAYDVIAFERDGHHEVFASH